jgi:hypothetical protein
MSTTDSKEVGRVSRDKGLLDGIAPPEKWAFRQAH